MLLKTFFLNSLIWRNFFFFFQERYKNLAAIKSSEWDEPKMLLKIVLAYFKNNIDEVCILFQMLPVFSHRFPVDIIVSFILTTLINMSKFNYLMYYCLGSFSENIWKMK